VNAAQLIEVYRKAHPRSTKGPRPSTGVPAGTRSAGS
jgi:hypothetical protein